MAVGPAEIFGGLGAVIIGLAAVGVVIYWLVQAWRAVKRVWKEASERFKKKMEEAKALQLSGEPKKAGEKVVEAFTQKLAIGQGETRCPFCDEPVRAKAVKCKHCGSAIGPGTCRKCGKRNRHEAKFCGHCGSPEMISETK